MQNSKYFNKTNKKLRIIFPSSPFANILVISCLFLLFHNLRFSGFKKLFLPNFIYA